MGVVSVVRWDGFCLGLWVEVEEPDDFGLSVTVGASAVG